MQKVDLNWKALFAFAFNPFYEKLVHFFWAFEFGSKSQANAHHQRADGKQMWKTQQLILNTFDTLFFAIRPLSFATGYGRMVIVSFPNWFQYEAEEE